MFLKNPRFFIVSSLFFFFFFTWIFLFSCRRLRCPTIETVHLPELINSLRDLTVCVSSRLLSLLTDKKMMVFGCGDVDSYYCYYFSFLFWLCGFGFVFGEKIESPTEKKKKALAVFIFFSVFWGRNRRELPNWGL